MRGVGDFGRGGAGFGGRDDDLRGRSGTDGGAARRGRDPAAHDGGLGGGARDPDGRDRRTDDFRGRMADALGAADRSGRSAKRGGGPSGGAKDVEAPSGAEALQALFQPRGPASAPAGDTASPAASGRADDRRAAVSAARPDAAPGDPSPMERSLAAEPAPAKELRVLAASAPDAAALLAGQPVQPLRKADVEVAETDRPGAVQAERVAARMAEALQAEATVNEPVTIAVPVAPGMDGIAGVSVTMTPGGVDVVLDRVAGAAVSDGLAAAAQDLVSRLQRRFPRGAVRVLEATRPDPAEAARLAAGWTPA